MGQKSEMSLAKLKPRCWQAYMPPGGSRQESIFLPFQA